jgi:hypothetical protein
MKIVISNPQAQKTTTDAIMNKVRMGNYLISSKNFGNRTEFHFTDKSCLEVAEYSTHYVITDFRESDIKSVTKITK